MLEPKPTVVRIDARRIVDWPSLHDVFQVAFGFPGFYGCNMNAWIDARSRASARRCARRAVA